MCIIHNDSLIVNGLHEWYVPDESRGGIERAYIKYMEITNECLNSGLAQRPKTKWEWFKCFLESEQSETNKWPGYIPNAT